MNAIWNHLVEPALFTLIGYVFGVMHYKWQSRIERENNSDDSET